jgi:uncharacterized membrane protein
MTAMMNEPGTSAERSTVLGTFAHETEAMRALEALREAGFRPEQVSVISRDTATTARLGTDTDMIADEAGRGAMTGTLLGGLAGWLIGLSAFAIPGVGPIVGAGIIGTTLAGAGLGAAAGGLVGALGTHGIPAVEARDYEEALQGGHILLAVHATTPTETARVRAILQRNGGRRVRSFPQDDTGNDDDTPGLGGVAYVS